MIETTFTLTQAEYLEAQDLFMREQNRKKRWWKIGLAIVFGFAALIVIIHAPRPLDFASIAPPAIIFLVIGLLPVWLPFAMRRQFKTRYAKEKPNLTNIHIRLDEKGYYAEAPGIGAGIAEWPGISIWHEGKLVFVLRSGYQMRVVPKAALTSIDVEQVRTLLNERIGPEGVSR